MIRRCHNPAPSDYENGIESYYHGRGIQVCSEWRNNFDAFYKWALNNGYESNLTIDRIDPDGNYEPSNCRWITRNENCKRARKKTSNISTVKRKPIGKYFTVRWLCGAKWGIVDKVHMTYHETLIRISEIKLGRGIILIRMKHSKGTANVKNGDIVGVQRCT